MLSPAASFHPQNKKAWVIVSAGVLLLVLLGYLYARRAWRSGSETIRISGNIEVTTAEVSFKMAGRVEERLVSEGEPVQAGQVVARLDSSELAQEVAFRRAEVQAAGAVLKELEAGSRPEEVAQAEAAMRRAQARLEELEAGSRPEEVAAAAAAVERARAEAHRWQAEYQRSQQLHEEGVIPTQQLEMVRAAHEAAQARLREAEEAWNLVREGPRKEQIEQAREALREARERYTLIKAGPRQETIAQARARQEQAQQALAMAETRLGYATLVSPLAGIVLSENIEPGEYVAPGTPVVTVGDLSQVWLRAYIAETDLGRIQIGQTARVTTDSYRAKAYAGRVSFLSSQAEFTPKNIPTPQERVKLVYRVKIDVPNPAMELKPGMPADAEIAVGGQ